MANRDAPHGFKPVYAIYGEHAHQKKYTVATTHAAIGIGDLIETVSDGTVRKGTASSTSLIGVAAHPLAANTGTELSVYDNPGQVFEAQTDDGTGALTAQTGIFSNANFIDTATTTDFSIMEIDENSAAVTATLPLKVIGLYPVSNNAFGEFNRLEVMINNHVYGSLGVTGLV